MTRKTQKKLRKLLTLVCCAVMLVCVSVGATIAYLTSQDTVVNTFTVGNVKITLDEAKVNTDGTVVANADRVRANEYKLMPGHTYTKDPTVHVDTNSENAYIRLLVTVTNHDALLAAIVDEDNAETNKYKYTEGGNDFVALHELVSGWEDDTWLYESAKTDGTSATYEFRYKNTTDKGDLDALFETITLPDNVDNAELPTLAGTEVTVVAQAIQADGFDSADEAWANWTEPVVVPAA